MANFFNRSAYVLVHELTFSVCVLIYCCDSVIFSFILFANSQWLLVDVLYRMWKVPIVVFNTEDFFVVFNLRRALSLKKPAISTKRFVKYNPALGLLLFLPSSGLV